MRRHPGQGPGSASSRGVMVLPRFPGLRHPGAVILILVALCLFVGYTLLTRIVLLFQNLYQSSFLLIPGAAIGKDYWASVDYGIGMAVLIGFFFALLALVAGLQLWSVLSDARGPGRRFWR